MPNASQLHPFVSMYADFLHCLGFKVNMKVELEQSHTIHMLKQHDFKNTKKLKAAGETNAE